MSDLSIVTVTYNAEEFIGNTLESIRDSLSLSNYELIVIDGLSTDSTLSIVDSFKEVVSKVVSEPDNGIFDAMNKGLNLCNSDWVIFINAGDEIRFNDDLVFRLKSLSSHGIVYGDTERNTGLVTKPFDLSLIRAGGLPMCHQSTLYNRKVLGNELYYKTIFSLFGENELLMRISKEGYSMKYLDKTIAYFQGGGISDKVSWTTRVAKYYYLYVHFGIVSWFKAGQLFLERRGQ